MSGRSRGWRLAALPLLLAACAVPAALAQPAPRRAPASPPAASQAAPASDWTLCRQAIAAAEPGSGVPPGLMGAIALVESGRGDPRSGRIEPWPWTYNLDGEGRYAASKAAAVAEVTALLAAGGHSIDVGCMQVNLQYHPDAFPGVERAFDPAANVAYAARFLRQLFARTGEWPRAVAQYHSGQPERGAAYQRRVALAQLGGAWAGGGGTVALPAAAAVAGLCAPGLRPALRFGPDAARRAAPRRVDAALPRRPRIVCQGRPGRG